MNARTFLAVTLIVLIGFGTSLEAVPRSDNFNDNTKGDQWGWFWINGGPDTVWLDEVSGRLELQATNQTIDATAIYGSVDWGLVTSEDFQMSIEFSHNACSEGPSQVMLAITNKFDFLDFIEPPTHYIQISAGCGGGYTILYYERATNGIVDANDWKLRSASGTLYMSYDADLDELYLSDTGYGSASAWVTIAGVIQGQWDQKVIGVAVGGNADGVELTSGQAYLDNFVIDTGTLCDGLPNADLNQDCKVDFKDFAAFALEWLDCDMDPQADCY